MNSKISAELARSPKLMWKLSLVMLTLLFVALSIIHMKELVLIADWWSTTSKYGHSFLIFPVIAYLIFERHKTLSRLTPKPEFFLIPVIFMQSLALTAFDLIDVSILSETILISMYPTIMWLILGREIIKVIYMPLLLLMTVVPAWELVAPILTDVTATVAHLSLNALQIPVFRDDYYLTIPEGVFEIAQGCGGFRYFIVGLSLGLIHAYLNFEGKKQRVIIIAAALALSISSNWLRVMIVIWAGHKTNMQHHFVEAHVMLGWYVFAIAFFLFFVISNYFSAGHTRPHNNTPATSNPEAIDLKGGAIAFTIGLLIIWATPSFILADRNTAPTTIPSKTWNPTQVAGWTKPVPYQGMWSPQFNGANGESIYTYRKGSFWASVYVAYYIEQSQGKELVNFNNTAVNVTWRSHEEGTTQFSIENEKVLSARKIRAESPEGRRTIWTWYYVAGTEAIDPRTAKLLELKKLLGGNTVSAVIAVLPRQSQDSAETKELTEELLSRLYPKILNTLKQI